MLGIIRTERDMFEVHAGKKRKTGLHTLRTTPFIQCVKRCCVSYLHEPQTLSRSVLIYIYTYIHTYIHTYTVA